jgi:drug/metabolite transporter (DMT)-like permease
VSRRTNALPWIALVAVYFLWGSTYLGIRVAVTSLPPYLMTGCRYVIAGGLMLALYWLFSKPKPSLPKREDLLHIAVAAAFLIVLANGLLCVAETHVESGTAALLTTSVPIWMLLFDAIRTRKMPGWTAMAGVVFGSIGMVVLVGRSTGRTDVLFAALVLIGSISWSLGSIYARCKEHHPLTAPLEMIFGGIGAVVVGLLTGEASAVHISAISLASLGGMLWLITAGAMVGYTAYAYAVRTLPTATVATYAYVNPVVAVILGAVLLREPITWNVFTGGALIVASVVLILMGNRQATSSAAVDEPGLATAQGLE